MRSTIDLAEYYEGNSLPKSALRHYQKAQELEEDVKIEEEERLRLYLGFAETYFSIRKENSKNILLADRTLKHISKVDISDPELKFRRGLLAARILANQNNSDTAFQRFREIKSEIPEYVTDEKLKGEIYLESGNSAFNAEEYETAKSDYELSRESYQNVDPIDKGLIRFITKKIKEAEDHIETPEQNDSSEEQEGTDGGKGPSVDDQKPVENVNSINPTPEKSTEEQRDDEETTGEQATEEETTDEHNTEEETTAEHNTEEETTDEQGNDEETTGEPGTEEETTDEQGADERTIDEQDTEEQTTDEQKLDTKSVFETTFPALDAETAAPPETLDTSSVFGSSPFG